MGSEERRLRILRRRVRQYLEAKRAEIPRRLDNAERSGRVRIGNHFPPCAVQAQASERERGAHVDVLWVAQRCFACSTFKERDAPLPGGTHLAFCGGSRPCGGRF